ncbi:uncharacterized protein LOC131321703 [Rhododendron vialii]|uniref:uncharacterized protein LOC131321703 n=1 Tax=Rhododendron vialii TaxID=182163 RepID=UPI00265D9819|nr:uncharacterized protein LOC131321703 [Rhododendron vialii]
MPGLAQTNNESQFSNGAAAASFYSLPCSNGSVANGFWSRHRNDVSYNQLQKFWGDLSAQARHELLRIDKQTLFEQARKNTYCSRCNGLLLEGFLQIVMHGKSLQQEGAVGSLLCNGQGALKNQDGDGDLGMTTACQEEVQDPSVHPWGGLTTTRDGTLTLLDCYLHSKSLKGLQIVFDSARARERERELLYPDACGGGGRGWISQGMMGYGRGHGTRETCALHTARLSVDTLVDFWSALGEETRQSLLRMKEEDFIERLMYRFDSKRFCRDCRRNVIREFKELKELKRMRREPRCTSWFCVADTAFQYEVSHDTVQADWHQTFKDNVAKFHYFEWAVGTGEGKSDILEFENVGTTGRVQVDGLDLGGLNACYITLRAWKIDGRCTELCVKAHALKGQQCVHCRLVVGDGFVTISRGESIRRFFEHAEEAEEEEDDDSMDKDGNDMDGECSRPQKHAKSPELAREFLLDAATVIFKEQVEKAFREGTARQNSHSIFVCLALKLLEERVHVACKEIITLEKQIKLLEEEEKEKREEEERKERRRTKEREKKLRRKERLRGKEIDREKKSSESYQSPVVADVPREEISPTVDEQPNFFNDRDPICETGDIPSPYAQEEQLSNESIMLYAENHSDDIPDGEFLNSNEENGSFANDHTTVFHRKPKIRKGFQPDPTLKWLDRRQFAVVSESGGMVSKSEHRHHGDNFDFSSKSGYGMNKQSRCSDSTKSIRNGGPKFGERSRCANGRMSDRCDFRACSCDQHNDYKAKVEPNASMRVRREPKSVSQLESVSDLSKPYYRGSINKYNQIDYNREHCGRPKTKNGTGKNPFVRDLHYAKKVWEPLDSQRKYPRSNSDTDVTLRSSSAICSDDVTEKLDETSHNQKNSKEPRKNSQNGFYLEAKAPHNSDETVDEEIELCSVTNSPLRGTCDPSMSTSNSDNCSSCLSEGDSNITSSNSPNAESMSLSDSEDGRETSVCSENNVTESHKSEMERKQMAEEEGQALRSGTSSVYMPQNGKSDFPLNFPKKASENLENGRTNVGVYSQHHHVVIPPMHNQGGIPFPVFQAPSTMGYFHQSPVSWAAAPANGFMPFPHPNHHYVLSHPFGYGLNGNSPFMQYDSLQHFAAPLLNPCPVPIYRPVVRTNGTNSKDQTKISKPGGVQDSSNEPKIGRAVPAGQSPVEEIPIGDGGQNGNSEKSHKGNSGFSLFHFGGPVALSTGKSNSVPPKDGIVGSRSSDLAVEHVQDDRACDEKDAVEEYNLFAASNGIKFSFF